MVGYGDGALAIVDLEARSVVARIMLPAHPEGFQIDAATGRAYVNLPDARTIAVVDLDKGEVIARWKLPLALWNYPLALAPTGNQLVSVFRAPAQLVQFDRTNGAQTGSVSTCGDADDVFYDPARQRIYVACGGGGVDVFDNSGEELKVTHDDWRRGADGPVRPRAGSPVRRCPFARRRQACVSACAETRRSAAIGVLPSKPTMKVAHGWVSSFRF